MVRSDLLALGDALFVAVPGPEGMASGFEEMTYECPARGLFGGSYLMARDHQGMLVKVPRAFCVLKTSETHRLVGEFYGGLMQMDAGRSRAQAASDRLYDSRMGALGRKIDKEARP